MMKAVCCWAVELFCDKICFYILLFIKLQHFFYVFPCVAESGYFMLSTEFPLAIQPIVEEVGTGNDDFQRLQCQVILSFSFIVGVYLFQGVVQYFGELLQSLWTGMLNVATSG